MRIPFVVLCASVCVAFGIQSVFAQTNSLFGNRGSFAQGGSASSFGSSGSSAFGTTGTSGLGSGGLGTGATGQGTGGLQAPQISSELGALSQTVGTGGFIGRSDTAGRFVGDRQAGQQTVQASGGGAPGRSFGGGGRGGGQGPNQGQRGGTSQRRPIRPQLRIAFDYAPAPATGIRSSLQAQLTRFVNRRPKLAGVDFTLDEEGTVVLTGSVPDENARKLAEAMIRLEPGVRGVRNELELEAR